MKTRNIGKVILFFSGAKNVTKCLDSSYSEKVTFSKSFDLKNR
jgi:hypothetical protein